MFARVLLLRRGGALLPSLRDNPIWDHGILELLSGPKHLLLRDAMSTPGKGTICALHAPVLCRLDPHRQELTFRGYELLTSEEKHAAVCQEWAIVFGSSESCPGVSLRDYGRHRGM